MIGPTPALSKSFCLSPIMSTLRRASKGPSGSVPGSLRDRCGTSGWRSLTDFLTDIGRTGDRRRGSRPDGRYGPLWGEVDTSQRGVGPADQAAPKPGRGNRQVQCRVDHLTSFSEVGSTSGCRRREYFCPQLVGGVGGIADATALTCTSVTPLCEKRAMIARRRRPEEWRPDRDVLTNRGITGLLVACGGRSCG